MIRCLLTFWHVLWAEIHRERADRHSRIAKRHLYEAKRHETRAAPEARR